MNALRVMMESPSCWDSRYELPLCPLNNNPWIYMAYADLVLRLSGTALPRELVIEHFDRCQHEKKDGRFWRWPDHSGGQNSHDEIMGAAYFDPSIANRILDYLDSTWGNFNVTGEPARFLEFNVYRMVFLRPYLLACAGRKVGLVSQFLFAVHTLVSAFTNSGPDNAGGRLRNWLMLERMRDLPLVRLPAKLWLKRIGSKDSLKGSLAIEPKEAPIIAILAPIAWAYPPVYTQT